MANGITARKLALRLLAALSALCAALALAVLLPGDVRTAHAAESGHAEHGADWAELSAEGGELAAGKYCLAADVKLTEDLLVSGEVTLCLNGYILTGTGTGPVIMVESGAGFTLCDCREGAADVANEINGVTYNSGVITGGTGRSPYGITAGGGIYVNDDYRNGETGVTMNGGAIAGNRADLGGGVYMSEGMFTMNGGTIAGNTAAAGEHSYAGGGVYVDFYSGFTMNGGSITGNTALAGGALYVSGDFIMNGGTIAGNTTAGGGVRVSSSGAFNINGGYFGADSIEKEHSASVSVTGGYFAADPEDTGYIPANVIADGCRVIQCAPAGSAYPYAVIEETASHEHAQGGATASFETALTAAGGALPAGNYYLACDITLESDLTFSGEVTLCLNGYVLTVTGGGSVVTVESGAGFTLCDCREGAADVANEINGVTYNGGVITGGSAELTVAVQAAGSSGGEETGGCRSSAGIGSAAGAAVILSAVCAIVFKKGKRRVL